MPDYSKSVIYVIRCISDTKYMYVGSTTQKQYINRLFSHKSQSKKPTNSRNLYLYNFIKTHGGWCNFEAKIVETFSAKTKRDLVLREFYWISKLMPDNKYSLNSIIH